MSDIGRLKREVAVDRCGAANTNADTRNVDAPLRRGRRGRGPGPDCNKRLLSAISGAQFICAGRELTMNEQV